MLNLKDKILKYGSFWLFLLAPIFYFSENLYPHISSKTFFIYGSVEILFFVWLYALITDTSYRINKKTLLYFLPVVLFVSWMTISGIFALNPRLAFLSSLSRGTGILTLYHSLAFSFLSLSLYRKFGFDYVYSILKYFILGGVLAVISIWLGPSGVGFEIKALSQGGEGGLIGNSSLAAAYSFFTIAFSLFIIFSKNASSTLKKFLWVGIGIIIFSPLFVNVAGFFNGSGLFGVARAGFLAIFVSIFIFFIFYVFLSNKKNIRNIGIILMLVSILGFGLAWNSLMTPGTRLHQKFVQSATGTRFIFWDTSNSAMNDKPILGYGPENYSIVFQKYFNPNILQKQNSMEGWTDKPHNMYFEIGVSAGYPAIIFYLLFLSSIFYGIYVAFKNKRINRIQSSLLGSLLAGYIFQNLFAFESNISILAIFLLSGIVFYATSDQSYSLKKIAPNDNTYNIVIGTSLGILFLFCFIFFTYQPMRKSIMYKQIFSSSFGSTVPEYDKLIDGSSIGSDWDSADSAYKVYQHYSNNAVSIKNNKKNLPQVIKNLDALISYLYKVQETNKTDFRLYLTTLYLENTMTFLLDRPITPDLKSKLYGLIDKAKELNPTSPEVCWVVAQLKVWDGDFDGAIFAYKDAIKNAPELPASYILAMNFAKAIGNQNFFNDTLKEAQNNIPGFTPN